MGVGLGSEVAVAVGGRGVGVAGSGVAVTTKMIGVEIMDGIAPPVLEDFHLTV